MVDQDELVRFLDKAANIFKVVSEGMPGTAQPQSAKLGMVNMKEEAISWAMRLEGKGAGTRVEEPPTHAVIRLSELEDALA